MTCTCKVGPGKYEGEGALTFLAHAQAMLGNSDAFTTDENGTSTDWLRHPLNLDADRTVVEEARKYGYCDECIAAAGQDVRGGVAVWEDTQGFVYCRVFNTAKEFDSALVEAEEDELGQEAEPY
jgi:hypothetical protein